MFLGAGSFQAPAIKKAVSLAYEVITVDYDPNSIGHRYSHHFVHCSTTDKDGVLTAAKELAIDGIMTFASDVAVTTVAHVAEHLDLPGPGTHVAAILTDKQRTREFQARSCLSHPPFAAGPPNADTIESAASLRFPVLVKPVDTSGSRGITLVDAPNLGSLLSAARFAGSYSRAGRICIEELVPGEDITFEGFILDGAFVFAVITKKHLNHFAVAGHQAPHPDSQRLLGLVTAAVTAHCHALDYVNGPCDADIRITPNGPVVIEMSPRLGGNGVPAIASLTTGRDLSAAAIKNAVGDEPTLTALNSKQENTSYGSIIFGSDYPGILESHASVDEIRKTLPALRECHFFRNPGAHIEAFVDGGTALGYAVFAIRDSEDYASSSKACLSALRMRVLRDTPSRLPLPANSIQATNFDLLSKPAPE